MSNDDARTVGTVDVDAWVDSAVDNPAEQRVRRIMKVILFAISDSSTLRDKMVIKGAVLLALQYGSTRHTRDVDFSTSSRVQHEDTDAIIAELDRALAQATRTVDSEVFCRVQSNEIKPPRADASFPTLRIKIGYAIQGEKSYRRMVQGGQSAETVIVDISFNETTCIASKIVLDGEHQLIAYSLYDQVAEKYRALVQQTGERPDRVRRQDIYDIYRIIEKGYLSSTTEKRTLLETMARKFAARDVPLSRKVIDEPEIKERAGRQYDRLKDEIDEDLPNFEHVFGVVRDFYLSLPW